MAGKIHKLAIHPYEETKLEDGTIVYDMTGAVPPEKQSPSFCFGYIFGNIYIGMSHHAEIMDWLTTEGGKDWEQMFSSPQRWGWAYMSGSGDDRKLYVRFSTDDAIQT